MKTKQVIVSVSSDFAYSFKRTLNIISLLTNKKVVYGETCRKLHKFCKLKLKEMVHIFKTRFRYQRILDTHKFNILFAFFNVFHYPENYTF